MSLKRFSHGFGESNYHLVLVPKYRRRIFKDVDVAEGCRHLLYEIAERYGYSILALEVMEDHIHLFIEMHPTHSVSKTFQLFKGITARRLFQQFPKLKYQLWGGHLWTRGKFFRSVGEVTNERIEFYINESQRGGIFTKGQQRSLNDYAE